MEASLPRGCELAVAAGAPPLRRLFGFIPQGRRRACCPTVSVPPRSDRSTAGRCFGPFSLRFERAEAASVITPAGTFERNIRVPLLLQPARRQHCRLPRRQKNRRPHFHG